MAFKVVSKEANKIVLHYESLSKFVCNAQTGYSYANAYNCAILSDLAYREKKYILKDHRVALSSYQYLVKEKFPPLLTEYTGTHNENGYQAMDFIEDPLSHTQGFIFEDDTNVYLVFRGTEKDSLEQVIKDLIITDILLSDSVPLKFEITYACKVHRGFFRAFNSILPQLKPKLPYFKNSKKPVIVCGHSLGGAIATIAAVYLLEEGVSQINIYTYGSPRVGDSDFAKQFASRIPTFRHVHNNDLVSRLPLPGVELKWYLLPALAMGPYGAGAILCLADFDGVPYQHFGKEIYLSGQDPKNSLLLFQNASDFLELSPGIEKKPVKLTIKAIQDLLKNLSIDDHDMENYIEKIGYALKNKISDFRSDVTNTKAALQKGLEEQRKLMAFHKSEADKALFDPDTVPSDATAVAGVSQPMSNAEKARLHQQLELNAKLNAGSIEGQIAEVSAPNYSKKCYNDITALPENGYMDRAFDKHLKSFS